MDSRSEPRHETDQNIQVTVLGRSELKITGQIVNLSGKGARLMLGAPIPIGTAVKIEWNQTLLLGEVCYCRPEAGGFSAGVELEHALLNTTELARLGRVLLGEQMEEEDVSVRVHAGSRKRI